MSHVQYGHIFKRYLNGIRPAGGVINPPIMADFTGGFPGGRLTLTSGLPVTVSDVTAAANVYYTPFLSNNITLWDGAAWSPVTFTEQTISLAAGFADATNYDVFGFLNAGALNVETLAWSGANARATDVTLQNGRYCKSGDPTRLYLGTFRTTGATTTEDSGGGTSARVGGRRFLWNMYNRVQRAMSVFDDTVSWSYTSSTIRQANAQTGNRVQCVIGLGLDAVWAVIVACLRGTSNSSLQGSVGVGVDSTTTYSGLRAGPFNNTATAIGAVVTAQFESLLSVGYHALNWCEAGPYGAGTNVFYGNADDVYILSGMSGGVWA